MRQRRAMDCLVLQRPRRGSSLAAGPEALELGAGTGDRKLLLLLHGGSSGSGGGSGCLSSGLAWARWGNDRGSGARLQRARLWSRPLAPPHCPWSLPGLRFPWRQQKRTMAALSVESSGAYPQGPLEDPTEEVRRGSRCDLASVLRHLFLFISSCNYR